MNADPASPRSLADHRADFPSLQRVHSGFPLAYLDGPAGTQVPRQVIDAIVHYYRTCNANTHGQFVTAVESDRMLDEARSTVAAFLGAPDASSISFGANMTTLTYALSRAVGRTLKPGDEVVITALDHEANRGPWRTLEQQGVVVREAVVRRDATLDYEDFLSKITRRTRLVAMGLASNAFGTVNDVVRIRTAAHEVGALLVADAVHYAPHIRIDVTRLDVDFLLCSAYKFYGPHVGILYARKGLLDRLEPDRLCTQDQNAPYRIETGTLNHAAIAGVKAAVEYLAGVGTGKSLSTQLDDALVLLGAHERALGSMLYSGLQAIPGVTVYGQPFTVPLRCPTVSFTVGRRSAAEVSGILAERGICTWDGHFYAIRPIEILGLLERGGVTRVGVSLYTTEEEIARLIEEVRALAS